MDVADLLTRWTIRLSLGLYVLVLAARLWPCPESPQRQQGIHLCRMAWTLGCLLALAHTACAFHFVHGWSHAAALESTANQTQQRLGIAYDGGLYWNYVFLLIWSLDVIWWWASPLGYQRRPRWVGLPIQGFLGFMAFNGAIVFASGAIRWVGVAACLGLVLVWLFQRAASSAQGAPPEHNGLNKSNDSPTDA